MAAAGLSLDNPVTGERIVFRQTGQDGSGSVVEFDHYMPAAKGPTFPEHVQLNQEERFEVVSGTARYRLNRSDHQAQAGETVVVPPGAIHTNCWNAGPGELHLRHSFHPGLGSDVFFEMMFSLAKAGKTNAKGDVNLLQLAVIGSEIESQTFNAAIPIGLQRLGLPVLAALGRMFGYRAR